MRLNQCMPVILALALGAAAMMPAAAHALDVTLHWTAPGDDGAVGQAAFYDLRFSYFPISEVNFSGAYPVVVGVPRPSPAGQRDSAEVIALNAGLTYYFALRTGDARGNWSRISNVAVVRPITTLDVGSETLGFSEPRPNPASTGTQFQLDLPVAGEATVEVFDVAGRRVRRLAGGVRSAGSHQLNWNLTDEHGRSVVGGLYLVRASLMGRTWVRRVAVAR